MCLWYCQKREEGFSEVTSSIGNSAWGQIGLDGKSFEPRYLRNRMVIMQDGIGVASGTAAEICEQGGTDGNLEEAFVNIIGRGRHET